MAMMAALTRPTAARVLREKGRRYGWRICACEQVSAEKEEGGGGRRKANGKVFASKQVSTLSLVKLFFCINPGFQPTKT